MIFKRKAAPDTSHAAAKKKRRTAGEEMIDNANETSIDDFKSSNVDAKWLLYRPTSSPAENTAFDIAFKSASELTDEEFDACFNLIKTTSQYHYQNSSFGWHVKRKKREMEESEMRYLLVRRRKRAQQVIAQDELPDQGAKPQHNDETTTPNSEEDWIDDDSDNGGEVEAFLSFMLTHDSSPPVPVLYIYEIHLDAALRSCGLGAHLMAAVEDIASKVGVRMVMLTCFLSNVKARSFYERRGYVKDVCSPEDRKTRERVVKVDYVIMSKGV